MKIHQLDVRNLRAVTSVQIRGTDVLALVGRNNSGKSTILQAVRFFFDPSKKSLSHDWFPSHDVTTTISIELTFDDLNEWEREKFGPWVDDRSGMLRIGREIAWVNGDYAVTTVAHVRVPSLPWLRDDQINGGAIQGWWAERDTLSVGGTLFLPEDVTSRPSVGAWKERAAAYRDAHVEQLDWVEERLENPQGAANVLKGSLPEFVYVPAVRDVQDETKVTQSNPFGRLLHSLLDRMNADVQEGLSSQFDSLAHRLNRVGGAERLAELSELEGRLNTLMSELMECDVELELRLPTIRQVFGDAQIMVDDGVRSSIATKGHGMQRSMIFTILRHYAELLKSEKAGGEGAERSTLIAIEEPELYMHPQSQRSLMAVLRAIATGRDQVLYTTHSSLFVDVQFFDQVCIMRNSPVDGQMRCFATQLTMEMMLQDLQARKNVAGSDAGMRGQYWHVFDSGVAEGFFADRVVVVEGPSEAYALPIYYQAMGLDLDRANIAVVHGDGKGPMDRLGRVFTGLGIPTFLWFDGDKSNNDKEIKDKTLELLELVGEPLESIEALTTGVGVHHAVLEEKLEVTLRAELPNYDELLQEARAELGPIGKPLQNRFIAKHVLEQVQSGLNADECVPPTIRSIVSAIDQLDQCYSLLHIEAEELRL